MSRDCRTRRSSEREPADSLGNKSNVIRGWLPALTFAFGESTMSSRSIFALCATLGSICFCFAMYSQFTHAKQTVTIGFVGFTNNFIGRFTNSDTRLAVFTVTNHTGTPVEIAGFYYIETAVDTTTHSSLSLGLRLKPGEIGTLLSRVPTNGGQWRITAPFFQVSVWRQMLQKALDLSDRARGKAQYNYRRYASGAPTSEWIDP
jgi:hypothetical protein